MRNKKQMEKIIVNRIRELMDCPDESLEEIREEQIKISKESQRWFVKNKAIFDYTVSCQVAVQLHA